MFEDIVLMGNSGAGKDLVAAHLVEHYQFTRIHPIGHLKSFLEELHAIPKGSLDTPDGKRTHPYKGLLLGEFVSFLFDIFGTETTNLYTPYLGELIESSNALGDFMINLFHLSEKLGVKFSEPYIRRMCMGDKHKVFLAIRNMHEAELIKEYRDYQVIELIRPGVNGLSTDLHQANIAEYLGNKTQIFNDGTIDELLTKIDNFLF